MSLCPMKNIFHILNGDSLKEHFPKQIEGEIIVARECLVDGEVRSTTVDELFEIRANFISKNYGENYSRDDYYSHSVSEFRKIQQIPDKSEINMWFEDDLFCQVNFWFTVNLLLGSSKNSRVFLIRPEAHSPYGFGGLNELELASIFKQKKLLSEPGKIASLWNAYKHQDTDELKAVAKELKAQFPFIYNAVEAHMDRIPGVNHPGRPVQTLRKIMDELGTDSFGQVFLEFNKRESIYGFGDLQVKRLFDEIKKNGWVT